MNRVSVIIPTFNHGKFIAQTLDGILAQKTDFDIEIIIGDDASTDDNSLIISSYQQRFPKIIKSFLHKKNLGPSEPRMMGGKHNVAFLFGKARSEYIALCEGDDYWTDELKLQKQVDFLDKNPDYALVHHQMGVVYEDSSPTHSFNPENQRHTSSLTDLLADESWFLGTASTVFRNTIRGVFPEWWMQTASGDLGIFILTTQYGKIKYLPETMAAYRKHSGGMTTIHTPENVAFLENRVKLFSDLTTYFNGRYDDILNRTTDKYQRQILDLCPTN